MKKQRDIISLPEHFKRYLLQDCRLNRVIVEATPGTCPLTLPVVDYGHQEVLMMSEKREAAGRPISDEKLEEVRGECMIAKP